jgi:hypothetical protein
MLTWYTPTCTFCTRTSYTTMCTCIMQSCSTYTHTCTCTYTPWWRWWVKQCEKSQEFGTVLPPPHTIALTLFVLSSSGNAVAFNVQTGIKGLCHHCTQLTSWVGGGGGTLQHKICAFTVQRSTKSGAARLYIHVREQGMVIGRLRQERTRHQCQHSQG